VIPAGPRVPGVVGVWGWERLGLGDLGGGSGSGSAPRPPWLMGLGLEQIGGAGREQPRVDLPASAQSGSAVVVLVLLCCCEIQSTQLKGVVRGIPAMTVGY
jgi:hypothetical protein